MENMILAGLEEGVGSCRLISVDRQKVVEILNLPDMFKVDSVLALGYPAEKPLVEEMKESWKYWGIRI